MNICYTIITGKYDSLIEPKVKTPNWRYICFTDNEQLLKSNTWEILPIPQEIMNDSALSGVKKQRVLKINPYKYLKGMDLSTSVYVDANLEINCNLDDLVKQYEGSDITVPHHPQRNCIYEEAKVIVRSKRDTQDNISKQVKFLEEEKFPKNFHLSETNVLVRKDTPKVREMMNLWEDTLRKYSHRDQMSFNYAEWKLNMKVADIPKNDNRKKLFIWKQHRKITIPAQSKPQPKQETKPINLISSDCVGGRYFESKNSKYTNPFIWESIKLSDFIRLIEKWDDIDLSKTKWYISNKEYGDIENVPTVIVDNSIKVFFHHHHQMEEYKTPTKLHKDVDDIDLGYCDIAQYLEEKWQNRLKRMEGEPVFCYNDKPFSTDVDIMEFINIKTPYKKILITCNKEYKKYENSSLKVHIKPMQIMNSKTLCDNMVKSNVI